MTPTQVEKVETTLQGFRRLAERELAKGSNWMLVAPKFALRLCAALGIEPEGGPSVERER
jgi:hypothetical protein